MMKQKFKVILQKLGLIGFARFIISLPGEVRQIISGFPRYFYNSWLNQFPIHWVRVAYLRRVLGVKIGHSSFIHMGARFNGNISIGNNTVIGRNCVLLGDIHIKNNASITAETYIFTTSHDLNSSTFACFYTKVTIEDYAWVGARAMILPGVTIGKGAVLGAASTATKSIPERAIFAGAPAKEIGKRTGELTYNLSYSPYYE